MKAHAFFFTGIMKEKNENTPKAIALAEAKAARIDAKAEARRRRAEEKAQWKIARQEAEERAREVLYIKLHTR
jgi:Tfp pilus assembly protein FimV